MTKHDIGGFGCPYYEELYDSGLHLILIPRKSRLKSALVYFAQGGFVHSLEIANSKAPFGTAYYLMKAVLSPSFQAELAKDGILSQGNIDYSYTTYQLDTTGDIFAGLGKLLSRLAKPTYTEEELNSLKEKEANDSSLLYQTKIETLNNLYLASPIRYGYIPSKEDAKRIHVSTLKKFQEAYYTCNQMCLILAMDMDPKKMVEELKKLEYPKLYSPVEGTVLTYNEDYKSQKQEYSEIQSDETHSILTYGVKFAPRENLFNAYGQLTFAYYEILPSLLFDKNPNFLDDIHKTGASYLGCSLKEGGEDTYLLLSFRTEDPDAVLKVLTEHFLHLDKEVTASTTKKIQEAYAVRAMENLANPSTAVKLFAKAMADHLPYTDLAKLVKNANFSSMKKFLAATADFRKAACYGKKGR